MTSNSLSAGRYADAFGARVTCSAPDTGMYLVIGNGMNVGWAVRAAGGRVVWTAPGSFALLAVMPATSFMGLRGHRSIAHIGPISVDSGRFNQFLAAAARQGRPEPVPGTTKEVPGEAPLDL